MTKYKKKVACGSKLVIVTAQDEFEIEAVAPNSNTPPPPPPDLGISFAASDLRYIGFITPGSDTDLADLVREAAPGARVREVENRDDAWILFEVAAETIDG